MAEFRFDGRTAIVTGAGGNPSLGRCHALLLAARGARVVVNDIGLDPETRGYAEKASAEAVAAEIRAAGGEAVADTHSVASEEGGAAIVQTALDAFGGVDILVNNAAVSIAAPFEEMTPRDIQRHVDVNLMGAVWTCRAAWPHFKRQGYGRVVNITSSSMTGFANQFAYAASKGGLWSLTRALAAEGAAHGIRVNAVSPGAFTRMVQSLMEEDSPLLQHSKQNLQPELSAPAVAWLCHEDCPVNGECIDALGGAVQRTFIARTVGIEDREHDLESLAARWDQVMAQEGAETVGIASLDSSQWKLKPYSG